MKQVYERLWYAAVLFMVLVADTMLPGLGFADLQSAAVWKVIFGVAAVSLPFLGVWIMIQVAVYIALNDREPTNQPTNQVGQLDDKTTVQPSHQLNQPSDQPSVTVEPTNQPTMFPMPYFDIPEPADLSDEVKRSVYAFAKEGSNKAAAGRLGLNPETVRKNMIKAREKYPEWVETVLGE